MQKYIQEQNRDELLDSIYRTASAMEILLLEIISTVREESVESLCGKQVETVEYRDLQPPAPRWNVNIM